MNHKTSFGRVENHTISRRLIQIQIGDNRQSRLQKSQKNAAVIVLIRLDLPRDYSSTRYITKTDTIGVVIEQVNLRAARSEDKSAMDISHLTLSRQQNIIDDTHLQRD